MESPRETLKETWHFYKGTLSLVARGSRAYYAWCLFLLAIILVGLSHYIKQHNLGLIETNLADQVSWGLYIANFTYPILYLLIQTDQRDRGPWGTLCRIVHCHGHPLCDG
jgi:hypothetical protein